jgi:iron-sulfur cluster assembly protein
MREKKTRRPLEVIQSNMVTLTPEAVEKIKKALQRYSASGVRIQARQKERGGISFSLDLEEKAHSDDLVLEDKGIKLFVDPSSAQHVQGIEIRYVKTEKGSGFAVVNPASG